MTSKAVMNNDNKKYILLVLLKGEYNSVSHSLNSMMELLLRIDQVRGHEELLVELGLDTSKLAQVHRHQQVLQ
jgi:hypothetical protein